MALISLSAQDYSLVQATLKALAPVPYATGANAAHWYEVVKQETLSRSDLRRLAAFLECTACDLFEPLSKELRQQCEEVATRLTELLAK